MFATPNLSRGAHISYGIFRKSLVVATTWLLIVGTSLGALPRGGIEVPELQLLDDTMADYMEANGIRAGLLGVMKDGVIALRRSYGYKSQFNTVELPHDAVMRVASITKPITAAAIRILIDETDLELDTPVFSLMDNGGVLELSAFPYLQDVRLADVTIRHCLQHRGGWDRDTAGDLTRMERSIADSMGVANPPGRWNTARYILGQALQSDPGSRRKYSNVGYMLLGLVLEKTSHKRYLDYIREKIFEPLGVHDDEVVLGRTLKQYQDPREPWYDASGTSASVFPPHLEVSTPYGSWDHEARVSQGRIVISTNALLRFLDEYVVNGDDIGARRTGVEPANWSRSHGGSLDGTSANAKQRGDGVNLVVIFNTRVNRVDFASDVRSQLDAIVDDLLADPDFRWPTEAGESEDPAGTPFLRGDSDKSGRVDNGDWLALATYLFGGAEVPCVAACDVNGDGFVNILDVSYLTGFVYGKGLEPVAPFPACGVGHLDTDRNLGCDDATCQ